MRLNKATFTIFDVETTGLYPYSGDKICEIGAIQATWDGNGKREFHSLIDPERPISYAAFAVNKISEDMVKGKPKIHEILPHFLEFIKGSVLVAYNAGFDLGFLECALGEDRSILDDYHVVDALILARRLFPDIGRYNLPNVALSLNIDSSLRHRALADAFMTWKVFQKELNILIGRGAKRVEDISQLQKKRDTSIKTVKDYKLKLIEEAIRDQKKLHITYHSIWGDNVTKRTITPKKIEKGYDKLYIVAHCHLKNEERNFRLDGIIEAKPQD